MDIFEQNKEQALAIMKQFVFPVKKCFEKNMEDSDCTINVSLHEKNGMSIGGLPANEQMFEITKVSNRSRNIEMYEQYLSNIDFIEIDSYRQTKGKGKRYTLQIKFSTQGYVVTGLNKEYEYGNFPNESDINFLLSEFKRVIL